MSRPQRSGKKLAGQSGLTRSHVLATALTMVDENGPAAFSMRRLAKRLGVTPMALYNHVRSKEDLLQAVAALVVDGVVWAEYDDWRVQIRDCFRALRQACLAHPGAMPLIEAADELPVSIFRPMELTISALRRAGLDFVDALRVYHLLTTFTLGQIAYQTRGWSRGVDAAAVGRSMRLDPAFFPNVSRVTDLPEWDFEASFEFGLSVILNGVAARAAGPNCILA